MTKKKMDVLRTSMLLTIYKELADKTIEMLEKYKDDQLIASTLVAQGLRVYKSVLSEEEFKDMLKTIVNDAIKIKPFFDAKEETIN
jgi:dihydrofolate reductase